MVSAGLRPQPPVQGAVRVVPPLAPRPEKPLSTMGYLRAVRTNAVDGWPRETYEQLVTERKLFGRRSLMVSDPDGVRRVLVDNHANYLRTPASVRILRPVLGDGLLISEGADWRLQRRALAPAFTPRAVEVLRPHVETALDEAAAVLDGAAARGPVDLFPVLHELALEIAGRTMFSVGMQRHGAQLRRLVTGYGLKLGRPHLLDMLLPLAVPAPLDLPRALFRRRWVPFLDRIIADRAAETAPRAPRDLLDLMASVRDPETGEGFAQGQLRDQVATMILAGHETTAVALLWACYLLALDPATQEAVAAEAGSAAGDPEAMPLTRAVVDETLRLYPPAFVIVRAARGPDVVAGHALSAGDVAMISPWVLHRHRQLWRDPDAFDPRRFLPGAEPPPRFAYLPFGAGPRVCIGAHFALLEAVIALSRLIGRFRVSLADDRPLLPAAVVTTQPDHPPAFRLERRND